MSRFYCPTCSDLREMKVKGHEPKGRSIWRRRECDVCHRRITTIETQQHKPIRVMRLGGRGRFRLFDAQRIVTDVANACARLDLPPGQPMICTDTIINRVRTMPSGDVFKEDIRSIVEEELLRLHTVAWYRYAISGRSVGDAAGCLAVLAQHARKESPHA